MSPTESDSIPQAAELIKTSIVHQIGYYFSLLDRVPGGLIILRYLKSSYKDDPIRSLFEFSLFVFALHYFLSSKKKENKAELVKFSKREIDELVEEWTPDPLVAEVTEYEHWRAAENHVKGQNSAHIELVQKEELGLVSNLSSLDFLNLNCDDRMKAAAKQVILSAGVGACGPPNFYGTQDVHVRLEEDLAHYLGTEQAILYGQDFVTAGSVIPAFLKRGDLAVVDSGVNLAIQKAVIVSRCDVEWYDHNDMEHLEQILAELQPMLNKQKPLRRRFIITEGLFAYTGDVADLPGIVALKNKYKYRLFLDETLSIGTLGAFGRGITEHYGISRDEVAITIGSMATSFASSGGFCAGVRPMIHHQRINSNAYVFSASLPPYSAKVVSEAIKVITESSNSKGESVLMATLHEKVMFAHKQITNAFQGSKFFEIKSDPSSPIIHLGFTSDFKAKLDLPNFYGNTALLTTGKPSRKLNPFNHHYNIECYILQKIIDALLEKQHALINRTRIVFEQESLPVIGPRLLIHVNAGLSKEEIGSAISALPGVVESICSTLNGPVDLVSLESELIAR